MTEIRESFHDEVALQLSKTSRGMAQSMQAMVSIFAKSCGQAPPPIASLPEFSLQLPKDNKAVIEFSDSDKEEPTTEDRGKDRGSSDPMGERIPSPVFQGSEDEKGVPSSASEKDEH